MDAIEIIGLYKVFKGRKGARVVALKNLSLTIQHGEVFGFLGPNGAGKSTTIKILMGLIKPSVGNAVVMGHDTSSHLSRTCVGYLPENPAFYDYLSAEEYLGFVGKVFDMGEPLLKEKIESSLKLLDLWEARKRRMRDYSKGMVQRLGLAQVLIHDPDIYILDEPMSGLDPVGRSLVKDIILNLKARGKSVFFSTHIISDVERICDRVGIIMEGTLRSVDRVESIISEGVAGYHIRVRGKSSNEHKDIHVSKNELPMLISELRDAGQEIDLIEPERKSLEDFFLNIIKNKDAQ